MEESCLEDQASQSSHNFENLYDTINAALLFTWPSPLRSRYFQSLLEILPGVF